MTGYHSLEMSCRKGKPKEKPKLGRYRCKDCGAVVKKKSDVCEPKKVKKNESGSNDQYPAFQEMDLTRIS